MENKKILNLAIIGHINTNMRTTSTIRLPCMSPGQIREITVHTYTPPEGGGSTGPKRRFYLQAALHADELPGILVLNHLLQMLECPTTTILEGNEIVVVPFANPVGLSQRVLGRHIGRFSANTGVNFNRNWPDLSGPVIRRVEGKLSLDSASVNTRLVRAAMVEELDERMADTSCTLDEEEAMRVALFRLSAPADYTLDLHCDTDATLHMYTHPQCWERLKPLAAALESQHCFLATHSGGDPFDEANSEPWELLQKKFSDYPIDMACASCTVELRGEKDVTDEYALKDARGIFEFLISSGFVSSSDVSIVEEKTLLREATDLTAVDLQEAPAPGILVWQDASVLGAEVLKGQLLAEIVDPVNCFAPRTALVARASGVLFRKASHALVQPGQTVAKVAGVESLAWRTGNLLTSK